MKRQNIAKTQVKDPSVFISTCNQATITSYQNNPRILGALESVLISLSGKICVGEILILLMLPKADFHLLYLDKNSSKL